VDMILIGPILWRFTNPDAHALSLDVFQVVIGIDLPVGFRSVQSDVIAKTGPAVIVFGSCGYRGPIHKRMIAAIGRTAEQYARFRVTPQRIEPVLLPLIVIEMAGAGRQFVAIFHPIAMQGDSHLPHI